MTHRRPPSRTLGGRALDAFRLIAMALAVMLRPLNELGLVGDAFEALAALVGTAPAILAFAVTMLYALYGMMLCVYVGVVLAIGVVRLLGSLGAGISPR